jgi:hypothetical protein
MYTEALTSKVRYWRMFWVGLSAFAEVLVAVVMLSVSQHLPQK